MRLIDADKLRRVMRNTSLGPRHLIDYCIDAAPTIEPTVPDRVLASDVVEGVSWHDGWYNHYISENSEEWANIGGLNQRTFSRQSVADMLQGCLERGERIDWPDGSPGCRFRKEPEPPTLLEEWEAFRATDKPFCLGDLRRLDAAAEREKAKQESAR